MNKQHIWLSMKYWQRLKYRCDQVYARTLDPIEHAEKVFSPQGQGYRPVSLSNTPGFL